MPAKTKQQEITTELAELRKQNYEALANATFRGFTDSEEAEHLERIKRMASLVAQLATLQEFPK